MDCFLAVVYPGGVTIVPGSSVMVLVFVVLCSGGARREVIQIKIHCQGMQTNNKQDWTQGRAKACTTANSKGAKSRLGQKWQSDATVVPLPNLHPPRSED